jgi:hypothetical protein
MESGSSPQVFALGSVNGKDDKMSEDWFDELKPIGAELPPDAAEKLAEVGETEAAERLQNVRLTRGGGFQRKRPLWPFQDRAWQHASHVFGYIPPVCASAETVRFAGTVTADDSLKGEAIRITLDRLRVADYPGGSTHHILLHFFGQNQTSKSDVEDVQYSARVEAQNGDHAGLISIPIFVGMNVGQEGISFRCLTINLKNSDDEALLSFLDSDVFRNGLKLLKTAQPAIGPLVQTLAGVTRRIATRNKNIVVQKFSMGLDFSGIATRAQLAEGSYIAMQVPPSAESTWQWDDWVYRPVSGHIVNRQDPGILPPYNYVIFSVSRMS